MQAALTLLETQQRFVAALYDDAAAEPVALIAGNGLDPHARLRIYRHACEEIQTGALRTSYPAVLAIVGAAFFAQTAHAYRRAHPSRTGNLQEFGDHLGDFLAGLPALRALAYLPDVARLEWLRQESVLSDEPKTIPDARCGHACLHPSVRLIASPHAVLTIWRYALQPTPAPLALPAAGERVLLWREGGQVAMAVLDPASFACIDSLAHGSDLAAAYRAGCAQDAEFDFAACIESLIAHGLLLTRAAPPVLPGP